MVLKADFMLLAESADLGVCKGESSRVSSSGMAEPGCNPAPAWGGSSPSLGWTRGPWKVATGPTPPKLFVPSKPLQHQILLRKSKQCCMVPQ